MMAYDPNIRASDTDRDRTASLLREHHAAGRLSPEEFAERLDRALEAKTIGEIDALLSDLPGIDLYRLPDAALTRQPRQLRQTRPVPAAYARRTGWRTAWAVWSVVTAICLLVWILSGGDTSWLLWIAGIWGAGMAGGALIDRSLRSGRSRGSISGGQGQLPGGDDLPGRPGR
jgi:hypothetical protein